MSTDKNLKNMQEQAVASWINYLNQVRFNRLVQFIQQQDINLENALADIGKAFKDVHDLINSNRGGSKGIHGFIAEAAEVGIGNARENILGKSDVYKWSNDNGMTDLVRDGIDIQQKFYQSELSLGAILNHLEKYPDFLKNGGKYQIPKDQYEKIKYLLSISKEEANKMPTADGTFSLKQWNRVQEFFNSGKIDINSLEPSTLNYKDVQRNQIDITLYNEEESLKETDSKLRKIAQEKNMPTLKEGTKATAISAAIEGGTTFILAISKKKKEGKSIKCFTNDDWLDILSETGIGTIKGGVRGISIYVLTNYKATPAAVASSIVTASFGIAEQVHLFRKGQCDELSFIENSEMLCVDATISALSSFMGQVFIPLPVVGAVIGNAVGTMMYKIAKDRFSDKEQRIIEKYFNDIQELEKELDVKYQNLLKQLSEDLAVYMEILEQLYSVDIKVAFEGSVQLAKYYGIPTEEILDTKEKIQAYFLD